MIKVERLHAFTIITSSGIMGKIWQWYKLSYAFESCEPTLFYFRTGKYFKFLDFLRWSDWFKVLIGVMISEFYIFNLNLQFNNLCSIYVSKLINHKFNNRLLNWRPKDTNSTTSLLNLGKYFCLRREATQHNPPYESHKESCWVHCSPLSNLKIIYVDSFKLELFKS